MRTNPEAANAKQAPQVRYWTPEVAEMVNLVDALTQLISVQLATTGNKPPPAKPRPRPETAFDRIRRDLRQEQHLSLVARLVRKPDSS